MPFLDCWSPRWAGVCLLEPEPPMSNVTQGQGPVHLPLVLSCFPGFRGAYLAGHSLEASFGAC